MKPALSLLLAVLIVLSSFTGMAQRRAAFRPKVVYTSDSLEVVQVSANAYQHISYLQTKDYGKVPCNGLVVRNGGEAVVFDTPTEDGVSEALIRWITGTLHCTVKAVIPTHFHNDCLAGLGAFHAHHIPSYANAQTIVLAKEHRVAVLPEHGFNDSLVLWLGDRKVTAQFFGEGHTKDNVVGYFPSEHVMFGGCLIKELDANKGFLGDANVGAWPATVERVKRQYGDVRVVVPGHGVCGNERLLDYTIRLFRSR